MGNSPSAVPLAPSAPSLVRSRITLALLAATLVAVPAAAQQKPVISYARAEQLLPWHTSTRILGDAVEATWYPDSTRFWYRTRTKDGVEFVLIDAARNTRGRVFDAARLARAMTVASDTAFEPTRLPFQSF